MHKLAFSVQILPLLTAFKIVNLSKFLWFFSVGNCCGKGKTLIVRKAEKLET